MKKLTIVVIISFDKIPISNLCVYFDFKHFFAVTKVCLDFVKNLNRCMPSYSSAFLLTLIRSWIQLFCHIPAMNFMISLNEKKTKPVCQKRKRNNFLNIRLEKIS